MADLMTKVAMKIQAIDKIETYQTNNKFTESL